MTNVITKEDSKKVVHALVTKYYKGAGSGKQSKQVTMKARAGAITKAKTEAHATKVAATKATRGSSVADSWISVLAGSVDKNHQDFAIAAMMQKAQPTGKKYTESDVQRHRSLYNLGKIKGQTSEPKVKLLKYVAKDSK